MAINWHLRRVQERLADRLADRPRPHGSAATIAAAHLHGHRAAILNVGDSRVYQVDPAG